MLKFAQILLAYFKIWVRDMKNTVSKIHSFLKQCSSFYENKVFQLMSIGFFRGPYFHQMKIVQTLFKNEWTLVYFWSVVKVVLTLECATWNSNLQWMLLIPLRSHMFIGCFFPIVTFHRFLNVFWHHTKMQKSTSKRG